MQSGHGAAVVVVVVVVDVVVVVVVVVVVGVVVVVVVVVVGGGGSGVVPIQQEYSNPLAYLPIQSARGDRVLIVQKPVSGAYPDCPVYISPLTTAITVL